MGFKRTGRQSLKQLSMDLDLNKRVERLTTMERIMVEIAKAYLMGSKLLVVLYPEKLIGQEISRSFTSF